MQYTLNVYKFKKNPFKPRICLGSTCGEISREDSIQRIADSVNYVHGKTKYVVTGECHTSEQT